MRIALQRVGAPELGCRLGLAVSASRQSDDVVWRCMRIGYFFRQVLLAMLVAVLLPLVAVQVLAGYRQYDETRSHALASVQHHADASAQALQALLDRARRTLSLAAVRLAEDNLDVAQCSAYLKEVFLSDTLYANAAVFDAQGRVLCSAAPVARLADSSRWLAETGAERLQTLSPPTVAFSAEPAAMLTKRIPQGSAPARVLGIALKVSEIARSLPLLGEGSATAVLDPNGKVLTRNPDPYIYLGRRPPWTGQVFPGRATETVGLDGQARFFALSTAGTGGRPSLCGQPYRSRGRAGASELCARAACRCRREPLRCLLRVPGSSTPGAAGSPPVPGRAPQFRHHRHSSRRPLAARRVRRSCA